MTWPYRQDSSSGSYLFLLPAFWEENRHTSLPLKNQPCVFKFLIVSTRNYCSLSKRKLFLENINMNKQLVLKCIWKEHIILFLNFFLALKIFFFSPTQYPGYRFTSLHCSQFLPTYPTSVLLPVSHWKWAGF